MRDDTRAVVLNEVGPARGDSRQGCRRGDSAVPDGSFGRPARTVARFGAGTATVRPPGQVLVSAPSGRLRRKRRTPSSGERTLLIVQPAEKAFVQLPRVDAARRLRARRCECGARLPQRGLDGGSLSSRLKSNWVFVSRHGTDLEMAAWMSSLS